MNSTKKMLPSSSSRILLRTPLQHAQRLPFMSGYRLSKERKARGHNVVPLVRRLSGSRLGRLTRFSAVGALGTVLNLLVMALLVHGVFDVDYLVAATVAAEISILHNFVLQERFVFRDLRNGANTWRGRLTQHLLYNNAEALIRLPFLILLVETAHVMALLAQAVTLAVAFVARFLFVSRVVYRARPVPATALNPAGVETG